MELMVNSYSRIDKVIYGIDQKGIVRNWNWQNENVCLIYIAERKSTFLLSSTYLNVDDNYLMFIWSLNVLFTLNIGQNQTWGQFHFVNSNSTSNLSIPIQFQFYQFQFSFFTLLRFTMSRYSEYLLAIPTLSSLYSQ